MDTKAAAHNSGFEAHRKHRRRTDNPYMVLAQVWDDGWVRRQKYQLDYSPSEEKSNRKISSFATFLKDRL